MSSRTENVIRLQKHPGGVAAGLRSVLDNGRVELITNGPNSEFQFIGSDPWNTNAYTGLVVPAAPSSSIGDARYLFMLARASFGTGEQSSDNLGVRLVGIRQYAELVARISADDDDVFASGPPIGSIVTLCKEIISPL